MNGTDNAVPHQTLADVSVATWTAARAIADMNEQALPTERQLLDCAALAISHHPFSDRLSLDDLILRYRHGADSTEYDLMDYEEELDDETDGWD